MKNFLRSKNPYAKFILPIILLLAFFLRLYGINWDQNQHLHPDERFLTMVTQAVKWPTSLPQYLNPKTSPLNPYNAGHNFFVYGTLPMKIVKFFSGIITFNKFDYNNVTLVGRLVSALFDIGIVYLVYKIGRKVFNKKTGLLASFLYTISVLPIQLSHFFAVDTFLVFFLTLSFYFLVLLLDLRHPDKHTLQECPKISQISLLECTRKQARRIIKSGLLGISFGLALACKISALYFLPIILLGFLFIFAKSKNKSLATCYLLLATFTCYFTFRFADPRAFASANFFDFKLNSQFIANIKQLNSTHNMSHVSPPGVQWLKTKPLIFPLKNIIIWGLGLPLGLLTTVSVIYFSTSIFTPMVKLVKKYKLNFFNHVATRHINHLMILSWILLVFFYQGFQFSKTLRYFYPIYPLLSLLTANFFHKAILSKKIKFNFLLTTSCFLLLLIWPISFISIYSRPHSRIVASEWIYQNIPAGSTISCEYWDDCLPLSLTNKNSSVYRYKKETLQLYTRDTKKKWQQIESQLENVDYLIMSSNRLWGSIPNVPEKYPITAKFYNDLFAEKLQFTKITEITSYPSIPILDIKINDDHAEEAFTVYDHPKILIYKKR